MIQKAFEKVKLISREEALKKREKADKEEKTSERVIIPMDYNPRLPPQAPIIKKHHKAMLRKNSALKKVFPNEPLTALQKPQGNTLICQATLCLI